MPNQILPTEVRSLSRWTTSQEAVTSMATTRSLVMTTTGPIYHLRFHRNPRFGLGNLESRTRDRRPYWLTVTSPPAPVNRLLKIEAQAPALAEMPDAPVKRAQITKVAKAKGAFLRDKMKRLEFLNYCLLLIVLADTAGLLTSFLVKVLTQW